MRNLKSGTRTHLAIWPVLLASTVLAGVPAHAQETGGLETITVTAEKRSEDLQKVPMNVQAITAAKLEDLHLTDFNDFVKYMPSVTWAASGQGGSGGPGFDNITMRGIASDQNGNHSGPLPTVGVYFDEQPITTINGTLDIPTYDIQRVEALSGPQGTLYGASSLSGTIRIISNKPDTSGFAASYQVGVDSVDHGGIGYLANGMVNIPISSNVALRIVGWDEHDAGYIDNVKGERTYTIPGGPPITVNNDAEAKKNYNTVNKLGGRAALEFDLNDSWTITPMIMGQTERTNGFFASDPTVGDLKVMHFAPEYVHDSWYQAALTVQGKIGDLDLVYSGGHMDRKISEESDYSDYSYWYDQASSYYANYKDAAGNNVDPAQIVLGHDHFTKDSHELRVSTPSDWRLHLTGGLFYERQTHFILQDYVIPGFATTPIGYIQQSIPGWPGTVYLADQMRVDRDEAAFIDGGFNITPDLTLNAGIRFFSSNNSLKGFFGFYTNSAGLKVPGCFAPTSVDHGPCTDLDGRVKDNGETHRVNLTWQVTDDKMLYATYSTGFRPGGVNRVAGVPPTYTPDTLDNYEIGWKTSWDDNRIRFNGDFFWEDWNNVQFSFLGPQSITIVENAGGARVKGVESDFTWLPMDSLTLTASGAYNDATLTQPFCEYPNINCVGVTPDAPSGTQLPITPKWKLNGVARYEWMLGDFNAHVQGSMVHQSGEWPDLRLATRAILGESAAYTTFDFTTGIARDNWSLELYVQNLTDERAQLGRFAECNPNVCGAETYRLYAQPRTIGLTFGQKF